jgi:hypothetical protein
VGSAFYYGVDHTPSYFWDSASWEISKCFIHYLPIVMGGAERWEQDETVRRAIEIREGRVQNPKILSFQKRASAYPHPVIGAGGATAPPWEDGEAVSAAGSIPAEDLA